MKRARRAPILSLSVCAIAALSGGRALAQAGSPESNAPAEKPAPEKDGPFAIHGQSTFILQAHPGFHSPYEGANSLSPKAEGRETFDATLFAGWRPWRGMEIWFNPEVDQGFGISNTLGLAGYSNGEGAKVGEATPYVRVQRLFLRQTINLGGKAERLEGAANQFAQMRSANFLTITFGKMTVGDVFDTNDYAHDARHDVLNWSLLEQGSFDYAADAWGYTVGGAVEWTEGPWSLRAGVFDLSDVPNSERLDTHVLDQFQLVGEIERRYAIGGRAGSLKVTSFTTRGRMGRFSDALALAEKTGTTPNLALVRRYQGRTGLHLNWQQALADDIGVFARAGAANGGVEPYEYADIDRSVSSGVSIKGARWGRKNDTVFLAGVINEISEQHRRYLAAGGLGILIGDGRLPHYGSERILETYYDAAVIKPLHVTFDVQQVWNPAYNRDRGPVTIGAIRLHAEF